MVNDLAGLSMLITAVAGVPAALVAARNSGKTRKKIRHELNPNHGSSIRDQIDLLVKMVSSQGHQIGEIRRDAASIHDRHDRQLERIEKRLDNLHKN